MNDRQPPEGGWDWPAVRQTFRSQIGRFDVAVWCGKRLCGLAIGTLGSNAVTIEAVEGSPASDCPLKGDVLLIVLQAASCYAQRTGREQIRIMEPAVGLVALYRMGYGFTL